MAVRQRGDSFQADVRVGGKRVRRDFATKALADAFQAEVKLKLIRGEPVEDIVTPPDQQCSTWEQLKDATAERHWAGAKSERMSLINATDVVEVMGASKPFAGVTSRDIDTAVAFWKKRGLSGSTVNRKLAALSKMLHHAWTRGWLLSVPAIDRETEGEGRLRWLSEAEEAEVVAWFEWAGMKSMAEFTPFLADTGLRLSEAVGKFDRPQGGLRWKDVADGYVRVWDSKNGDNRSVPQTDRVAALLAKRWDRRTSDTAKVWEDMAYRKIEDDWARMRRALKKQDDRQFIVYALRHTFASRLVQRGVELPVIKELMGHKSLAMTLRYAHLHKGNHQDAIRTLNNGQNPLGLHNRSQGHTSDQRSHNPVTPAMKIAN